MHKSFFKRGIIGNLNHMFSRMSTAKLAGLKGENVIVFCQEWTGRIFQLWQPRLSALVSWCPGPHPACLLYQAVPVTQILSWQLPLLPLGSSSRSGGMPCCFSSHWQHSCCCCMFQCRHSVPPNPWLMVPLWPVGHESSHSALHWWTQSSSMHVWFWMRRCQSFHNP